MLTFHLFFVYIVPKFCSKELKREETFINVWTLNVFSKEQYSRAFLSDEYSQDTIGIFRCLKQGFYLNLISFGDTNSTFCIL